MGKCIHVHFQKQYLGRDRQEQSWGEEGWGWGDFGCESPGSKERSKDSIIDQGGMVVVLLFVFVCLFECVFFLTKFF